MDDIQEIENRMRESGIADVGDPNPVPSAPLAAERSVIQTPASVTDVADDISVAAALNETALDIVARARERIRGGKASIERHARSLERNANDRISNEIERQSVENARKKAGNEIDRKALANELYRIKEESRRLREEQRHLTQMQRQEQRLAKRKAYWEAHKETLEQYGMHEGSSRIACEILLWLDGVKGFFVGLSKVSDAIVKALKWILIVGLITGVLMAIPATREWILTLLGFIK